MEQINESKHHLEIIFDSISEPIFSVNPERMITRLNRQFEAVVGTTFSEILKKKCYTQLYKRRSKCENCPLEKILSTGKKTQITITVDNSIIYNVDCFPLIDTDGKVISMVEFARDVTREERMRKELINLQEQTLEKSAHIASQNMKLEKAYNKISRELELARMVQRGILPQDPPSLHELRTGILYMPMEEVGGDLYDFIQINEDILGILMVDVTGHGIPAAFIAAMAKISFYLHAKSSFSTARVFTQVNHALCSNLHTYEFFLTTLYCIVDLINNRVRYSNAGHPPLLIYRKKTGQLEKFADKDVIMGFSRDAKFKELDIELNKGDRMIIYTDGVYECLKANSHDGFSRFKEIILSSAHLSAEEQVGHIKQEIKFVLNDEPPADDISLLVFEITLDNKYICFELNREFETNDNLTILAVRHPLEFEKVISRVLHVMDREMFHDSIIRNTKFAIYEALSMYYNSDEDGINTVYAAYKCTKKDELTLVIVDNRYLKKGSMKPYYKEVQFRRSYEIMEKNVEELDFIENGKKIVLKIRNR
ncbi:MAG: SpoIIE family protein phosphatase [Spirochaetales bacterium]|nr:SpoIIE family protein phosphatase [Spirochaetales bacterium]